MKVVADMAKRKSRKKPQTKPDRQPSRSSHRGRPEAPEVDLQNLLSLSAEGVFLIQGSRIVVCNRFLAEKAGYAIEEVIDSIFASFFDAESIEKIESELADDTCPAPERSDFSARLVCKNGDVFKVRIKSQACIIGGESVHLVVLSESGQPAPAAECPLNWKDCFFPEESPAHITECGCC